MTLTERFRNLGRLIGERIELVAPSFEMADAVYRACRESSNELRPFMPWMHEDLQLGDIHQFVQRSIEGRENGTALDFWIVDREDRRCLGGVGLKNFSTYSPRAELGYWIRTGYTGHGYASEAVRVMLAASQKYPALERVDAMAAVENTRSQNLLKRCGFVEEGLKPHCERVNGRWQDMKLFGRQLQQAEVDGI